MSLKIVAVGHVDHGKSTLLGRLLVDLGSIVDRDIDRLESVSHVWDIIPTEQEKSKTLEFDSKRVTINNKDVIIVDVPGHRNLVHEMIAGATDANIAIIVTSARSGELKDGVVSKQGNLGQIVEHCILLKAIGVQNVIIAVNKMDTIDWSKKVFKTVVKIVTKICKRYKLNVFCSIPLSAKDGVNIKTSDNELVPWYEGLTLIDALSDLINISAEHSIESSNELFTKKKLKITTLFVSNELVTSGSRYILHSLHGDVVGCEIVKFRVEVEKGVFVKKPFIRSTEEEPIKAEVKITLDTPINVKKNDRFIIRNSDKTIAIGFT